MMSSFLTDNAISDSADDNLNFGDFRPALKNILTTAETPLTVGIFGAWGSGKTSLMRMLRAEIAGAGRHRVRTIWFTAWKYDRQDVLWRSFMLRVIHALYPRENEPKEKLPEERPVLSNPTSEKQIRLIKLLERLEESIYQASEWSEKGERDIRWLELLGHTGKAGVEVAATVQSAGLYPQIKKLLGGDDTPIDDIQKAAAAVSRETMSYRRRQLFHMEQFEDTFKEAVSLIEEARLIVFVDDLDRCLPEKAIEVLEAIKLFLEVPGVVFVLGMDREVVHRGIEARYGHFFHQGADRSQELPISGDSYLQKIVQIPFHLPALAIGRLDGFIGGLDTALDEITRQVFAHGLYPNPRQVKRALNIFHLLQQIALEREKRPVEEGGLPAKSIAWPLLAKTVIIQTQYPDLYQLWRQYPLVVQLLEESFSKRIDSEDDLLRGRRDAPAAKRDDADEDMPEKTGGQTRRRHSAAAACWMSTWKTGSSTRCWRRCWLTRPRIKQEAKGTSRASPG